MNIHFLKYLQIVERVLFELVNFISAKNRIKNDILFQKYKFFLTHNYILQCLNILCQTILQTTVFILFLQDIYYIFTHKTSRNECIRGCFSYSNLTCTENQTHFYLKKYFCHLGREVGMLHYFPHSERPLGFTPFNMLQFYQCYILYFSNT